MNSLRVDTYLNVYEIADVLAKRANVNAIHDLALVKAHTALSKSGDIEVGLEELEQFLSLGGVEESIIINRLAEIDDAMYAVSHAKGNHIGSSYFAFDGTANTNQSREILQRSENYIKDYLYGEKSIVDRKPGRVIERCADEVGAGAAYFVSQCDLSIVGANQRQD